MARRQLGHTLKRIREVRPAELAYRLRQMLRRGYRRNSLAVRSLGITDSQLRRALKSECHTPEGALSVFKARKCPLLPQSAGGNFQFSALERFDGGIETRTRAEALAENRFLLLNRRWFEAGSSIDWHRKFDADGTWPRDKHWSLIDPRRGHESGDVKLTWELNRLQHFLTLGRAFRYSQDPKLSEAFERQFCSWREQNPYEIGVNWTDCLEVGIRIVSLAWGHALFRGVIGPDIHWALLKCVHEHADHILHHNTDYANANNHLIGEALGLFVAGAAYPEFRDASRWEQWGRRRLEREIVRQVHADGGSKEQSTDYHCFVTEMFIQAYLLAEATGKPFSDAFTDRLQAMLRFLNQIIRPDSTIPQVADGDDAFIFATHLEKRPQTLLALGAAAFGRPELARRAILTEDAAWCLAENEIGQFQEMQPNDPPLAVNFPETQWAAWRSDWSREADFVLFESGPFSLPWTRVHGHASRLNLDLVIRGKRVLSDPGTYTYFGDQELRDYFRRTSSHSCMVVNEEDQCAVNGTFSWESVSEGLLLASGTDARLCYAMGKHDGYLPKFGTQVYRSLVYLPGSYLLVVDAIEGGTDPLIDSYWHFDRGALHEADFGYTFTPWDAQQQVEVHTLNLPDRSIEKGWVSNGYGLKYETPVARARTRERWSAVLFVLLPNGTGAVRLVPGERDNSAAFSCRIESPHGRDECTLAIRPVRHELNDAVFHGTFSLQRSDPSGKSILTAVHGSRSGEREEGSSPEFLVMGQ
jgi:hypothetical protein